MMHDGKGLATVSECFAANLWRHNRGYRALNAVIVSLRFVLAVRTICSPVLRLETGNCEPDTRLPD